MKETTQPTKAYKGFNMDGTCRGFEYEEGKEYEMDGDVECCERGFHACQDPMDCFRYYDPAHSIYREVEQSGKIAEDSDDSKRASSKIKIGVRLDIPALCKAKFEYVRSRCTMEHTNPKQATAGSYGAATAGDSGAATAGESGAATAGDRGAATAGSYGAATAGYCGAATAGDSGAATAGYRGAATAGSYGAATAGSYGAATAGYSGAATAGDRGAATSRGKSASGVNGLSVARGNNVMVKGGIGAVLVLCEEQSDSYDIKEWKAEVVDGERIKADTWYKLVDGEFKEVKI